ncbi:MAG: hypothetical protein ACYCPT_02040 [Acidimicrobiales bacterium]
MAQPAPFVPARTVIEHLHGSKNRIARYMSEQEKVNRGLAVLREAADKLYLELESSDAQDAIPMLTGSLEAAMYGGQEIALALERVIAIERHFQHICKRWLRGMAPLPHGRSGQFAPYTYEKTTAREVPTPLHDVKGHYEDKPIMTADGNHPSVQGKYVDKGGRTLAVVRDGVALPAAAAATATSALPVASSTCSPQPVEEEPDGAA